MNKVQFWILNVVGVICGGLILLNLYLFNRNEKSSRTLMEVQEQVARAQQVQNTMQNLAVRIAQAGREESSLSNLLVRHDLRVNLNPANAANPANPETPAKTAP